MYYVKGTRARVNASLGFPSEPIITGLPLPYYLFMYIQHSSSFVLIFKLYLNLFFSVEVVLFREDYNFGHLNMPLMLCIVFAWCVLWLLLIIERLTHGRVKFLFTL